ncbi:MAG TPA: GNAT family N-acetyltransferase, partial [Longimicrobium sp.]|nr:GNAT family N-acetyltransferase [Longimicrobium sp.]
MPLPPAVEVLPAAPEQEPVLANLLELYAHDLSELFNVRLQPDGRFGYPSLSRYWEEEGRFPFLVKVDGELAGFVLVSRGSRVSGDPAVWDMAEFFIARGFRKRGIGAAVA